MNLLSSIQKNIEEHQLIPSETLGVAVSGGADSIALLRALHALGYPCAVLHLNHQLRADESDQDEAFVKVTADELGLPCITQRVDVAQWARSKNSSLEMAGREARHAFFHAQPYKTIALAHHANDQLETVLLRLMRGSGLSGLGGMSFTQPMKNQTFVRPMLTLRKKEILDWLHTEGYTWREDQTNQQLEPMRNRIRHTLIPALEDESSFDPLKTLHRSTQLLQEEDAWLDTQAACLTATTAHSAPLVLRRRWVRNWLHNAGVSSLSFERTQQLALALEHSKGSLIVQLNAQYDVYVEYGIPRLVQRDGLVQSTPFSLTIENSQGWKTPKVEQMGIYPACAYISQKAAHKEALCIRNPEPGDRFQPLGMQGSRKLQDILTDEKLPQAQRDKLPIVTYENEIVWIPGYTISERWKVTSRDEPSLHLELDRIKS